MTDAILIAVTKEARGRIIAALAMRFRDLDLAEEAFAGACEKAVAAWRLHGTPYDPSGWLYRVAERRVLDSLRRRKVRERRASDPTFSEPQYSEAGTPESLIDESGLIPDERLRLIFICCHPAVSVEARAALTLRLVCGLSTLDIAQAFLLSETTLAQRLVRAKRKIADAGVPFEVPRPEDWPERLNAVLSTLEVVYAKAHEDAAGAGAHAGYATEILELTRVLAELAPGEPEVLALAALVRYAEARRPARLDEHGAMVPLAEQDPTLWRSALIQEADRYFARASASGLNGPRVLQAAIHGAWCRRTRLSDPPPWEDVLALYDLLLIQRDDPVVHLNRAVAVAEVSGVQAALQEMEALVDRFPANFLPFQAARADILRRAGRLAEAREAYDWAIELNPTPAERMWLSRQRQKT